MKIALAHHWITSYRGGERVLEQIASLVPGADVHTLVNDEHVIVPGLADHRILPSMLNRLPRITDTYRHLVPFHPWAISRMKVADDVDVLISSDAALIKGISLPGDATHICYCHSPPRYLWELGEEYKKTSLTARFALDRLAPKLRAFDYEAAQRVTHFIANSKFVSNRIRKYYDRASEVIYPPVAVNDFRWDRRRERFALVISELVPYKRIDIVVAAFNKLGKRLVVIGDGPERKRLESMAKSNIQFLGRQPFSVLKSHYETASVFVFPGIEDFGITPVEAQAAGCPVLAFRAGGALETVQEGVTGEFFDKQDGDCLADAVQRFDSAEHDPSACSANAEQFSIDRFREKLRVRLAEVLQPTVPLFGETHPVEHPRQSVA